MADDLSSNGAFREVLDRLRILETTVMLQNAAVTEGRLRFIGGLLRVDSGGRVEIVGTLQIDGTTNVTGSFNMTGTVDMEGNVTITGPLTVEGLWDLTGDGTIAGNVEVTGDMKTVDGGRIIVSGPDGDTVLTESKMIFGNGSEVASYSTSGVGINSPGLIMLNGNGLGFLGIATQTASASGLPVNALGITPLGIVFRVVAG